MAKFAQIKKSIRNRRTLFELPLLVNAEGEAGEEKRTVTVALVGLDGEGDRAVLSAARAFARESGVENPKPGEPLYERGLWLHTVLRTVMDSDVPDKSDPFFASAEEILKFLDPDRISVLFHAQRAWQAKCAPPTDKMNDVDYIKHIVELAYAAEEEERDGEMRAVPFDSLPFAMQLRFVRRLASQFSTWISTNSLSGSATATSPSTTSSSERSTGEETEASVPTASPSPAAPDAPSAAPVPDDASAAPGPPTGAPR